MFVALLMAQPVHATPVSVSYLDEQGDLARWNLVYSASTDPYVYYTDALIPELSPIGRVGYCDILQGSLTEERGSYVFGMKVAGDLPTSGQTPGVCYVIWAFWPQFSENYWDCWDVVLVWDGASYSGAVWDYRPCMETEDQTDRTETPVEFLVGGSTLEIIVPARMFPQDDFYWVFRTVAVIGEYDFDRFKCGVDFSVDWTDPEYAVTPYPDNYASLPWLPWPSQ
jgi:hypothetical protein